MANVSYRKTLNVNVVRGDDFVMYFEFYEDCDGTPVDLINNVNATFTAQVRDGESNSDTLILDFTQGDFTVVLENGLNNIVRMDKLAVLMEVDAGEYYWEMTMKNNTHNRKATIFAGEFNILENLADQQV
jgi:hypothetical protein